MHRFVFATFNRGKVREVDGILSGLDIEVLSPVDLGVDALAAETGDTFLDNAVLKAAGVYQATGLPTFADDSGLEVASLGGAPGVQSARYAGGDGHDDQANIDKLLSSLRDVPDRRARFVCTVACLLRAADVPNLRPELLPSSVRIVAGHPSVPAGAILVVAEGEVAGRIIDVPRGVDGFGYDPVFWRDDVNKTFAELTAQEKNGFSHRGHAFRAISQALDVILAGTVEDRR